VNSLPPYKIFSLGSSALVIDFGNVINEKINRVVIALFKKNSQQKFPGFSEAVPAYSPPVCFYDAVKILQQQKCGLAMEWVKNKLKRGWKKW